MFPVVLISLVFFQLFDSSPSFAEPIEDNSFLVEEAYNQEAGVVQFIQLFEKQKKGKGWDYLFVNELPAPNERHQISYEIPVQHQDGSDKTGLGDLKFNYRMELVHGDALVATGRLTTLFPTGDRAKGFGTAAQGYEASLITSVKLNPYWVQHWNAGAAITPSARNSSGDQADLAKYFFGLSNVYLLSDRLNLMLELVETSEQEITGPGATSWTNDLKLSPSVRYGIDWAEWQFVPGIAFPFGIGSSSGTNEILAYLSIEGKMW